MLPALRLGRHTMLEAIREVLPKDIRGHVLRQDLPIEQIDEERPGLADAILRQLRVQGGAVALVPDPADIGDPAGPVASTMAVDRRENVTLVGGSTARGQTEARSVMTREEVDHVVPANDPVPVPVLLSHDPPDPADGDFSAVGFQLLDQTIVGQRGHIGGPDKVASRRVREGQPDSCIAIFVRLWTEGRTRTCRSTLPSGTGPASFPRFPSGAP